MKLKNLLLLIAFLVVNAKISGFVPAENTLNPDKLIQRDMAVTQADNKHGSTLEIVDLQKISAGNLNDSMFVNLNEVLIYKSLRENDFLSGQSVSASTLSGNKLDYLEARDIHSISGFVPNLHIPDYGSKITSAIYIRGVGSRLNSSAVAFYVDDLPYLDKSAFDHELQDLQRVDILRGPQGTLYGRNASGGLIHVYTESPFEKQGTKAIVSVGNYNNFNLKLSHSRILNQHFALSVSSYFKNRDGFTNNNYTGKSIGGEESFGVGTKFAGRFSDGWNANINLNIDRVKQDGYPYAPYDSDSLKVNYNDSSSYKRSVFVAGFTFGKVSDLFTFNSVTGFQMLNDDMWMDQDFTPSSIFTLNQKQKIKALTQEFVFKSGKKTRWEWTNGIFASFQIKNTDSPVKFKSDGIVMLENSINGGMPSSANTKVDITDNDLNLQSLFDEQNHTVAFYHMSTYHFNTINGLSASLGFRLGYENMILKYNSSALMNYNYLMTRGAMKIGEDLSAAPTLSGSCDRGNFHFIPKFSLNYKLDSRTYVYTSIAKGYQSGGYNIQLFSDLLQTQLQSVMTGQLKTSISGKLQPYVNMGMPQASLDAILAKIPVSEGVKDVASVISYAPEYSWNYEIGLHAEPIEGKLSIDASAFYIDLKDRQIAMYSPNGFGRMMKNAASSMSRGFEISVIAKPVKKLSISASYGFTDAKYKEYKDTVIINRSYGEVDYSGKKVSMIPECDFSIGADYVFSDFSKIVDGIKLSAQYNLTGNVYWNDINNIKQDAYGITDVQLMVFRGDLSFKLWAKNLFNNKYNAFYFENMGKSYVQQGSPFLFGFTTKFEFR